MTSSNRFFQIIAITGALIVLGIIVYASGPDRDEVTAMRSFFESTEDYRLNNAVVAIGGLRAPLNVHDTYEWSLAQVDAQVKESLKWREQKVDLLSDDWDKQMGFATFDEYSQKNAKQSSFPNLDQDARTVMCVITQDIPGEKSPGGECASAAAVGKMLSHYGVLLKRYHQAVAIKRYVALPVTGSYSGQTLMNAHRLFLADLVLKSRSQPDRVIKDWIENTNSLRSYLSSESTLVDRAILLIMYGMSQRALPVLIDGNTGVAQDNQQALSETLRPFGPREMNLALLYKAEYKIWYPVFKDLSERNQLAFYRLSQEYVSLGEAAPGEFDARSKTFLNRYSYGRWYVIHDVMHPAQSVIVNLLLNGISQSAEMIKLMHKTDARNRLLNFYVRMKSSGVNGKQILRTLSEDPSLGPIVYSEDTRLLEYIDKDLDFDLKVKY